MTFETFKAHIEDKEKKFFSIPSFYLNDAGKKKLGWYSDLAFSLDFCHNFSDVLESIAEGSEFSKLFSEQQIERIREWAEEERKESEKQAF